MNTLAFQNCLSATIVTTAAALSTAWTNCAIWYGTGIFLGLVECDIELPEDLHPRFDKFPPIFVNRLISRSDIGPHMQKFAVENGLMKTPRRALVSVHKADPHNADYATVKVVFGQRNGSHPRLQGSANSSRKDGYATLATISSKRAEQRTPIQRLELLPKWKN